MFGAGFGEFAYRLSLSESSLRIILSGKTSKNSVHCFYIISKGTSIRQIIICHIVGLGYHKLFMHTVSILLYATHYFPAIFVFIFAVYHSLSLDSKVSTIPFTILIVISFLLF